MEENTKILVVDDDPGISEMLKTLLEFSGYDVVVTAIPDDAENLIITEKIDLVMLDMLISGVNGTDVCARLRRNPDTKDIPVVMMSALHNAGQKCRDAGANDFIAKPFEMEDLIARIEDILRSQADK